LLTEETEATLGFVRNHGARCRLFYWSKTGRDALARVIGQRWEIYNYETNKTLIPKRGEMVVVSGTTDYGANVIALIADGTKNIKELYNALKDGDVALFQAAIASEARLRVQGDSYLSQAIAGATQTLNAAITAEAQALQSAITDEAQNRQREIDVLHDAIAQIINLLESDFGSLPRVSLITSDDDGFYFATTEDEDSDYLVVA
jgi:hypothetical protein